MNRRNRLLIPLLLALTVLASACGANGLRGGDGSGPRSLIVSATWVSGHQGGGSGGAAGGSPAQARIASLQKAVTQLRDETHSGWVGRQDDVTGYLGSLYGGSYTGTPDGFAAAYATAMFGVDANQLTLGEPDAATLPGVVTQRATQSVSGVPVLDASLVFTTRPAVGGGTADRLVSVSGRVFPGLSVGTTPTITADQAVAVAQQVAQGTAQGTPSLVVVPTGTGVLTWRVVVTAASGSTNPLSGGIYFIDALTGRVVSVTPTSADSAVLYPRLSGLARGLRTAEADLHARAGRRPAHAPSAAADPGSVDVTGTGPTGDNLKAKGVQTSSGVELRDTTTSSYDAASGEGGITTYDASKVRADRQLPGTLVTSPDTTIRDPDSIAAQAYSRDVFDYYQSMGRNSFDGKGGSMISSVHYGAPDFCNSFFTQSTSQPQMIYGNPCTVDGDPQEATEVDIDTAGHEITHGVTFTSAGLIYDGQSGALNEAFSDYFGNVIGNRVLGTDSVAIFEGSCTGITHETVMCTHNPDGTWSLRYMLNGATYDDYLRLLAPGFRLAQLGLTQDQGGVHENSAIWNNALWSIRTQLAKIDNQPGNDSPRAQSFDKAVFVALTSRLTPTSGFVDAANAVMQVISDAGMDPVILRTAQQTFQANRICDGCADTGKLAGDPVVTTPQGQVLPAVSGDRVAWLDLNAGSPSIGSAGEATVGGAGARTVTDGSTVELGFAGDALVTLNNDLSVTRIGTDGTTSTLGQVNGSADSVFLGGLTGSDAGAAWMSDDRTVNFADPTGKVTSATVSGTGGAPITSIGTGGGTVALGTASGQVLRWQPGGQVTPVGTMTGPVLAVAAYAGNVFAIDQNHKAVLFKVDGTKLSVSDHASVFGAALSGSYAVWSEIVGPLPQTKTSPKGGSFADTDLGLVSLGSGKIYDLVSEKGQQGFPALSGNRLVWQDTVLGGDDVFTASLPDGL